MEDIGRIISQRRKHLGVTQEQLSDMSGISRRSIEAIEQGTANPTLSLLTKILTPLGLVVKTDERIKYA